MVHVVNAGSAKQIGSLVNQLLSLFPLYTDLTQIATLRTAMLPQPVEWLHVLSSSSHTQG